MPLFSFADTVSLVGPEKGELFVIKEVTNAARKTVAHVDKDHYAMFFKNGAFVDTLGEGKHKVVASNETDVSVVLIYASKSASLEVKWATPVHFEASEKMSIRGEFEVGIGDLGLAQKALIEEGKYSVEKVRLKLRNRICSEIQPIVAKAIEERGAEIMNSDMRLAEIVRPAVSDILSKDYGLKLVSFGVSVVTE